jgi:hypothetical protein
MFFPKLQKKTTPWKTWEWELFVYCHQDGCSVIVTTWELKYLRRTIWTTLVVEERDRKYGYQESLKEAKCRWDRKRKGGYNVFDF